MKQRQQYDFVDVFYNPEITKFDTLLRHRRSTAQQVSKAVNVDVSPKITSIQFDHQSSELITAITSKWLDKRFLSNSSEPVIYTDLSIWTPEFSCSRLTCGDSKIYITKYGRISTSRQYRVKSQVVNQYLFYPFIVNFARFEMNLIDPVDKVRLEISGGFKNTLLAGFHQNSIWNVITTDVFVNDTDDHSRLVFKLGVKRKLDFSLYHLSPVIVFTIMIPVGFIVPCKFSQKCRAN